jgi:hypothetical protein
MARTKLVPQTRGPRKVVERNIELLGTLMRQLLAEPQLLGSLPRDFELVVLPDDDPELRLYNLDLLKTLDTQGKPIVFARLKSAKAVNLKRTLDLYVPLAA